MTEAEKAEREAKINNFMNIYMNQYSKVKLGKNGKTFPLIEEKRPIITEKPLVEQVREMAEKAVQKEELEVEMLRWGTTMYSRLSQSNWGLGYNESPPLHNYDHY